MSQLFTIGTRRAASLCILGIAVLIFLLAACGNSPTITPSPVVNALEISPTPFARRTLPATWTPTSTFTAVPPTATRTPTLTPTTTPTLSPEDVCAAFFVVSNLNTAESGKPMLFFKQDSTISLIIGTDSVEEIVHFRAVNRLSGNGQSLDIPGGTAALGVGYAINRLPGTGLYDWTLSVQTPAYGDLCEQGGSFIVIGRESTRAEERTIR